MDGVQERLITGVDAGGAGRVYTSSGTSPITALDNRLYSSSTLRIPAVARAKLDEVSTGDEVVGDGTTFNGGASNLPELYRWP